ncbi:MAG TPA: Lrp/AsnC ligand binding domain-containing protein [Anaerolineaceae bacterium]
MEILDSTLREGEQTPYVNFTIDEKLEIARLLDKVGVEMIEAGDPSVSPQVFESVKRVAALKLNAEIVAHSLAIKANIDRAKACNVDRVVVFYPTSKIHLESKVKKSEDEAIDIICEHVRYARSLGLKVRFSPEDASRTDLDYLVRACNRAIEAGADRISFADTLGIMQPHIVTERISYLRKNLLPCKIDMHFHNDFGLAIANGLAGVRAGADCIHTTVNGLGERTGIADLAETIMAFHVLEGVQKYDLSYLMPLSTYLERVSGFFTAPNKPITGQNAYSHKSGVHTNGVLKDPRTYENFDPAMIGRERHIIIDKYTGKLAVQSRLDEYGIKVNDDELSRIVVEIKNIGDRRKILHDSDILEIAEKVTGRSNDVIPKEIHAMILISVEAHVYTSAVVRRLKNFKNVENVLEITGAHDISIYIRANSTADLNNLIEEIRTLPGVKQTETKIVLKKHSSIFNPDEDESR